ncbi:MAG TPA: ribonuclease P protein component [Acidimicrobiia bacterium]|nr:ribonuclease P protein component [Acidimicrobiia bacterium]
MTRAASDSPPDPSFESLRSSARFREILRRGHRRTVGGLTVVSLANVESRCRVGLVAGRRLGSAVTRNRIKRRIRHACRNLEFTPGWDHVVIPTAEVARVPFDTLVGWLRAGIGAHD